MTVANPKPADRVRVRADSPPGHVRTPWYLRGKTGIVERCLGPTLNPEQLAYGLPANSVKLYRVRFTMAEIWGEYCEAPNDTLDAEVFSHWLELEETGRAS